jgi:AcrR family transcriptional regulator
MPTTAAGVAADGPATVHVVATTPEGTEAALTVAAHLAGVPAKGQAARIVLVVPRGGEDDALSAPSSVSLDWLLAHYQLVAQRFDRTVQVAFCDGRDPVAAIKRLTPDHATVVVGGAARWLWPSAEERVAARLRRAGREVVFVGCNGRRLETYAWRPDGHVR